MSDAIPQSYPLFLWMTDESGTENELVGRVIGWFQDGELSFLPIVADRLHKRNPRGAVVTDFGWRYWLSESNNEAEAEE